MIQKNLNTLLINNNKKLGKNSKINKTKQYLKNN